VPAENLLGETPGHGFRHAMQTLDRARPGVASQGVGLAAGALELATVYAGHREQFGAPIMSFQMIQGMLADMATRVEAARHLVYAAAKAVDDGAPNLSKLAAMCKLFATDTAMEVTTDAVQVFGGYGYMKTIRSKVHARREDHADLRGHEPGAASRRRAFLIKEALNLKYLLDYVPEGDPAGVNDRSRSRRGPRNRPRPRRSRGDGPAPVMTETNTRATPPSGGRPTSR
jgi:alkylation response protein AidB-like acyl-CoA dehydrogenase